MKILAHIAATLLGLLFIAAASFMLFGNPPIPENPKDSPAWHFNAAFGPTGYMIFVKVLELIGGLLLVIPLTRNLGLLVLGPIIVNILAYHQFVARTGLIDPQLIAIIVLSLFLLWVERAAFAGLVTRRAPGA